MDSRRGAGGARRTGGRPPDGAIAAVRATTGHGALQRRATLLRSLFGRTAGQWALPQPSPSIELRLRAAGPRLRSTPEIMCSSERRRRVPATSIPRPPLAMRASCLASNCRRAFLKTHSCMDFGRRRRRAGCATGPARSSPSFCLCWDTGSLSPTAAATLSWRPHSIDPGALRGSSPLWGRVWLTPVPYHRRVGPRPAALDLATAGSGEQLHARGD